MRCKYCHEEIALYEKTGAWHDYGNIDPELCTGIMGVFDHAPEDSPSALIEEIEQKIAECYKTLAEIERLTKKMKEGG